MRDAWNEIWLQITRTLGLYGKTLDIVEPVLDVGIIMAEDMKTVSKEDIEDRISQRSTPVVTPVTPVVTPKTKAKTKAKEK